MRRWRRVFKAHKAPLPSKGARSVIPSSQRANGVAGNSGGKGVQVHGFKGLLGKEPVPGRVVYCVPADATEIVYGQAEWPAQYSFRRRGVLPQQRVARCDHGV